METALAITNGAGKHALVPAIDPRAIEDALAMGDLSKMSAEQRVAYYLGTCASVGLNPYTKPFDAIKGDDDSVHLYPNKSATEQLRRIYSVSLRTLSRERVDGLYLVTVLATLPNGRQEEAVGAVPIESPIGDWRTSQNGKRYFQAATNKEGRKLYEPLRGVELANALKKAETQAKRRATLGICGLGFLDAPDHGEAIEVSLGNPPALQSRIDDEREKPMQEHIADIFGDSDVPDPQTSSEIIVADPETGRPDGLDEPAMPDWLTEAKATAQLLREAEIAGSLQGEAGLAVLSDLEAMVRDPDKYTQAQRTMRMVRAEKLRDEVMPH